jgi:hypothetical protein
MMHRYLSLAQEKTTIDYYLGEIELCYGRMNKDGLGIPKNLEEALSVPYKFQFIELSSSPFAIIIAHEYE